MTPVLFGNSFRSDATHKINLCVYGLTSLVFELVLHTRFNTSINLGNLMDKGNFR